MPMVNIQIVKELLPKFRGFMSSEEGRIWNAERNRKDQFFQTYFKESELSRLDEGTLREMIHTLWAWNSWTNSDHV